MTPAGRYGASEPPPHAREAKGRFGRASAALRPRRRACAAPAADAPPTPPRTPDRQAADPRGRSAHARSGELPSPGDER